MRRRILRLGAALAGAGGLWAAATGGGSAQAADKAPPPPPPNLIVIVADDLGYNDLGIYGARNIRTPNINALAASGIRFTQAYVPQPQGAPSRAGLLTGRYPQRFGYEFDPPTHDLGERDAIGGASLKEVLLSQVLKTAGYATGMVGAWGLGDAAGYRPGDRGFDEVSATAGEGAARDGVAFVDRHKGQPFFLYMAYGAPPASPVAGKYWDRYPNIADKGARSYAATVSALDDVVGALVGKLKAEHLEQNTLIVFLSDNGCPGELKGACSNAPLSGFKGQHLEGGIRVPFIVAWPGHLPAGVVNDRQVSSLDITPTAAALAHVKLPRDRPTDGVDLMPYLSGVKPGVPNPTLYWRAGPTYAIRDGDNKLLMANIAPPGAKAGESAPVTPDGVAAKVGPEGRHVMLYDLRTDPAEKHNLASADPKTVTALQKKLKAWDKGLAAPQWTSRRQGYQAWDGVVMQVFD